MDEERETLAAYAHSAWAAWMDYLYSKAIHRTDGAILIPEWAARRWLRQKETPYADLPEAEKESDRAEADKMLAILRPPDALALATASLLDQAAGVAELLQEAGDYIDDMILHSPLAPLINREAGADLVMRIAQALHGASAPEATCPACGTPLLRRAGRTPTCPNDLCNYVAKGDTPR